MINKLVSHYQIIKELGRGGMGEVYLAQDTKLDRLVALKFLPRHISADEEEKKRFVHEAKAASALDHPNICTVYEINETSDGQLFIAMGYCEGQTLAKKLKGGPLPIREVVEIAAQIAEGLKKAHAKGIVHRDLKPANVMLSDEGVVKIVDFGLAKLKGLSRLTKTGTTLGTVAYMSPEQAMGKEVDRRADIWSLGVVFYEMLTGNAPFRGEYEQAVVYSILNEEPELLSQGRPDIPSGLKQIVSQALAKNPAKRYQRMEEFLGDLKAVAEGFKPLRAKRKPARGKIFGIKKIYLYAGLAFISVLFGLNVGGVRSRLIGLFGGSTGAVRLAVLPFANLSDDPQQEYFSDGMTQEMIAQLGRLHPQSLSVIARTSVMRYKKSDKPIDQIGRELGVSYVLEGSARREAGRIRISAELIAVRDQAQLWADTYEGEMSGILTLQSDVARKVAGALALKLLPSEQARLTNIKSVNPEAYDAYLKGSQCYIKLTKSDLETAESYFNIALQKNPNYAAAYAGLALVWGCRNQMGIARPSEAVPKMKAAALKAVSLDDNLAEAHYALAAVKSWHDWDLPAAGPEWERAIELNPNYPDAQAMYSHFLMIMSRPDEAMAMIERGLKLDPFNVLIQGFFAVDLVFVRRYDEAIVQARKVLSMQPGAPLALATLWIAFRQKGMHKEALAAAKDYYGMYGDADLDEVFKQNFEEKNYVGVMRRTANMLAVSYSKIHSLPSDVVDLYLEAGDWGDAMEWLEKGFEERDPNMPYLNLPQYDPLRSNPRFQELRRRMKLPLNGKK